MSHFTQVSVLGPSHMNESRHVTHMNESRHTYGRVTRVAFPTKERPLWYTTKVFPLWETQRDVTSMRESRHT